MSLHPLSRQRQNHIHPVQLVGAGPGDPGLLTLHAYQALQQADVVLYDALVSQPILDLIPAHTECIAVGKRCGAHSMAQTEIERLMLAKVAAGFKVVRLKGGDPLLFGRGAEEISALKQAGFAYRVIPGVTAGSACAAYGAIPLTHRGLAQGVSFVTGHGKDGAPITNWQPYVIENHTLVIYMGLKQVKRIQQGLLEAGMSPEIPLAIVGQASQPTQQRIHGTLANLVELAAWPDLPSPATIIIGEVTTLAKHLDWFMSAAQSQAWDQCDIPLAQTIKKALNNSVP